MKMEDKRMQIAKHYVESVKELHLQRFEVWKFLGFQPAHLIKRTLQD